MILAALALVLASQQLPAQNFPPIDHPGADPLLAADLRASCPSAVGDDRNALFRVEAREGDARQIGRDADGWSSLGCTRALLFANGALSHEGRLMIAGDSWAQGALKAFLQALAIRPGDRHAADLLATLAMNDEEPRDLQDAVTALDRAVSLGAHGNATLRGCADLGLRAHRPDLTRRCAMLALSEGKDSTWHSLLISRLSFRDTDSLAGSQAFIRAAGAAHDTTAKLDVAWHLQWFLSPDEQKAWAVLPDGARGEWMRDHLASRDVRDGQPAGARLAEHFKRLEYVEDAFRLKVPRMLHKAMLTKPSGGMWPGPQMTTNGFAANIAPQGQPDGSIEAPRAFRDYMRWQVEWDDRGVIWMRFGEPRLRAFEVTNQGNPFEIWRYDLDGQELLMTFVGEDFDGSAGATRLLTGHISDAYCGIDEWRCRLSMLPRIAPEVQEAVRQQDREYISAGTTNDDNSVRTDNTINLVSRMHRLWDPVSGASLALLTYAVKSSDLVVRKDSSDRSARVEFQFRRWDTRENRWQDTSFARRFDFGATGVRTLTGFVVTPSSPSVSSWSLVATQSSDRRGRSWDVTTAALDTGAVALSDLVLGQQGQGVKWVVHNADILLAPLNAVDRTEPVSLYYQVRAMAQGINLKSTVSFYRVENRVSSDSAALQVSFDQSLHAGINEIAPSLDLSHLAKGSYRLEVRLTDTLGVVLTRRSTQLNLE